MAKAFIRDGYSFRPYTYSNGVRTGWDVYRKGERTFTIGSIRESSDGQCFIISSTGHPYDARRTLEEAVTLLIGRQP